MKDAFVFNVIEHIIDPLISAKQLTDIEQIWIDAYWDQRLLFNGRPKAESTLGLPAWNKGKKGVQVAWNKGKTGVMAIPWNKGKKGEYKLAAHSEASRQQCSESNKGKHHAGEPNPKLIEAWKHRPPMTQETRDKLSAKTKESWRLRRLKSATPDNTE